MTPVDFPRAGVRRRQALHRAGRPGAQPRRAEADLRASVPRGQEDGRRGVLPPLSGAAGAGARRGLRKLCQTQRRKEHFLRGAHARHALRRDVRHVRGVCGDRLCGHKLCGDDL